MTILAIPASNIVNKLNIMSYNSACTIRTITVAFVHSIYSQSMREPARRDEGNEFGQYCILICMYYCTCNVISVNE